MKSLCILLALISVCDSRRPRHECQRLGCNYDFNIYCLRSGHLVLGDCRRKRAVCVHGEEEDPTFRSCVVVVESRRSS